MRAGMKAVFVALSVMFLLSFLSFSSLVSAKDLQVGVSPTRITMGELAPGSETYSSFSLVTQSQDELQVRLNALSANPGIFDLVEFAHLRSLSTEEDGAGWVKFPANPIVILPMNASVPTEGGSFRGWRSAGFIVQVPKDAEPCYHAFQIMPTPAVGAAYDTGVNIAAVTLISVVFKVQGNCTRSGTILDIQQGDDVSIDTYFKNTGTATASAHVSEIRIYDENGVEAGVSTSKEQTLKPGAVATFKASFGPGVLMVGRTYKVVSTVSFGTGNTTKSTFLTIEHIQPAPVAASLAQSGGWTGYGYRINPVILIIVILVVAYLIYKRE